MGATGTITCKVSGPFVALTFLCDAVVTFNNALLEVCGTVAETVTAQNKLTFSCFPAVLGLCEC